jgi:hypothetical protein
MFDCEHVLASANSDTMYRTDVTDTMFMAIHLVKSFKHVACFKPFRVFSVIFLLSQILACNGGALETAQIAAVTDVLILSKPAAPFSYESGGSVVG